MRLQLLIVLFLFFFQNCIAQDIYDKKSSLAYSKYLIANNNLESAAKEYSRISFLDWETDTILYQMSLLYWLNNDNKNHQYFNQRILEKFPNSDYVKLLNFNQNPKIDLSTISKDTLDQVLALKSLVFNSKWSEAEDFLIGNTTLPKSEKIKGIKIIESGLKVKTRSPILGSVLSTAVPGLGKVYAKEYKDAAFAFMFVASSVFSLYRVVNKNGWDSPWSYLVASLSTGFYLGNIFGSYHSVKKYNIKQHKNTRNEKFRYLLD